MRAGWVGFRVVSHNRHDIRIGAFSMEVIRQTRPDGRREQMAEQQDTAAAHADLEESGAFVLDPDDIVTYSPHDPPARSGQLAVGTDMQNGAGALCHACLMSSGTLAFIGTCAFGFQGRSGGCILLTVFWN
jgi:hypothetical protein